jgi:hypothetical protein
MWAYLQNVNTANKKPYWFYKLVGDVKSIEEINANQHGVSGNYYRLKKFYGPVIGITKNLVKEELAFFPVKPHPLVLENDRKVRLDLFELALSMDKTNFFRSRGEKFNNYTSYQDYISLASKEDRIKIWGVRFNDWDKLLVLANAFVNFKNESNYAIINIQLNGSKFSISANELTAWIIGNEASSASSSALFFFKYLDDKYGAGELFEVDFEFENDLYPMNKIDINQCLNAGWTYYYDKEVEKEWLIDSIYLPKSLLPYIECEFRSYAIAQADSSDSWESEQRGDE